MRVRRRVLQTGIYKHPGEGGNRASRWLRGTPFLLRKWGELCETFVGSSSGQSVYFQWMPVSQLLQRLPARARCGQCLQCTVWLAVFLLYLLHPPSFSFLHQEIVAVKAWPGQRWVFSLMDFAGRTMRETDCPLGIGRFSNDCSLLSAQQVSTA